MFLKTIFIGLAAFTLMGAAGLADPPPGILDANAIDRSVSPCQDFYKFACGNWQSHFQLPPDKDSFYRQFSGLDDLADATLQSVLERFVAGDRTLPSSAPQQLAAFYSSCINETQISKEAYPTVKSMVDKMEKVKTPRDLARLVAQLHLMGVNVLFNFASGQDLNDSTKVIGFADQGGLSLPDQDYYFNTKPKYVEIVSKFKEHVAKIFALYGVSNDKATAQANMIYELEKHLAAHAMKLADRQDSSKVNHPGTRANLKALTPVFSWDDYFTALGTPQVNALNVDDPEFYKGLNETLKIIPLANLKVYFSWQILNRFASDMTKNFDSEHFQFWSTYLKGTQQDYPRARVCTRATEGALQDALAQAYVSLQSADAIKAKTKTMLDAIRSIFGGDLQTLSWLDDPTRAAALAKLAKVGDKIGFPDHWRNFNGLNLGSNYVLNDARQAVFNSHYTLDKIGKPVDPSEWGMPPWEADAYYDPSRNELVLPFAELLPPVMDLNASDGANFGSLGATTIGHELTHGFDSNGSQFDGNGNFKDWWTPSVRTEFQKRTQCLVDQASAYQVVQGLNVNGALTLTENLADQGGMKLALEAYKKIAASRAPAPDWEGFNETQQYFISFAQAWCSKTTDEELRLRMATDVHPPTEFRVNGVIFNRPEFAEAFGCTTGDRMAPANRCAVW